MKTTPVVVLVRPDQTEENLKVVEGQDVGQVALEIQILQENLKMKSTQKSVLTTIQSDKSLVTLHMLVQILQP